MVFGDRGLWEVIHHNCGTLMNEIYAIIKETPESTLIPSAM